MANEARALVKQGAHDNLDLKPNPSTPSATGSETSRLELLPTKIQQIIFKYYFRGFEITIGSEKTPKWRQFLTWSLRRGPVALILANRSIYNEACPLMDISVTRTFIPHNKDVWIFVRILGDDIISNVALALRINSLRFDDVEKLSRLYYSSWWPKSESLRDTIKLVEVEYDIGSLSHRCREIDTQPYLRLLESVITLLDGAQAGYIADFSTEAVEDVTGVRSLVTDLMMELFDNERQDDALISEIWHFDRWFDLKINVTDTSTIPTHRVQFTIVLPFGRCQDTCPAKTLVDAELEEWRNRRYVQSAQENCSCILLESSQLVCCDT